MKRGAIRDRGGDRDRPRHLRHGVVFPGFNAVHSLAPDSAMLHPGYGDCGSACPAPSC